MNMRFAYCCVLGICTTSLFLSEVTGALVSRRSDHDDHDDHDDHHDHHDSKAGPCACAAAEEDHPFTIDCENKALITANTTYLKTKCGKPSDANCKEALAKGDGACNTAFLVLQAHHDHCGTDVLDKDDEQYIHDWEAHCIGCTISRSFNKDLSSCAVPDCEDKPVAMMAYNFLKSECSDPKNCCLNEDQQAAYRIIYAYHAVCDHDDIPSEIEKGIHDFEHACEDHECNTVGPDYDAKVCPSPDGKVSDSESDTSSSTLAVSVAVPVGCVLLLAGIVAAKVAYNRGAKYAMMESNGNFQGNLAFEH